MVAEPASANGEPGPQNREAPAMRRVLASLTLAAVLVVALTMPVAAGGKPDKVLEPTPDLVLPGGVYCDFDVLLHNVVDQGQTFVYPPTPDGDQRLKFNGHILSTVTNLENASHVAELSSNAQITIWLRSDGSVDATFGGQLFAFYTAEEAAVSTLGQGMWYVRGHGFEHYGPDGVLTSAGAVGRVVDVCALVA
jgi:hypothetical protein